MELIAKGTFYRDLENRSNRKIRKAVKEILMQIQQAKTVSEINHLKKLKKFDIHYRIKVTNDYRIGVIIRGNKIWLTCFGHRNNFYNKFP